MDPRSTSPSEPGRCRREGHARLPTALAIRDGRREPQPTAMIMFPDDPKFPGAQERRGPALHGHACLLGGTLPDGRHEVSWLPWTTRQGPSRSILMMMLNDKDTGAPLALMSANLVSAYRTGGIPGVGARSPARTPSGPASWVRPRRRPWGGAPRFEAAASGARSVVVDREVCDTIEDAATPRTTTVADDISTFPWAPSRRARLSHALRRPFAHRASSWWTTGLYDAWEEEYRTPPTPRWASSAAPSPDLSTRAIERRHREHRRHHHRQGAWPHLRRQTIIYSVGGMPVEDIAWGHQERRQKGIGVKQPWDTPEMA